MQSVYNIGSGSWLILKMRFLAKVPITNDCHIKDKISVIFDHGVHQIKDKMSVVNNNKDNKIF